MSPLNLFIRMNRLIIPVAVVCCSFALTLGAAEGKKKTKLTDEQKAVTKELTGKYDSDKNGKLDKQERKQMTTEDKKKWNKIYRQERDKAKGKKKNESSQ